MNKDLKLKEAAWFRGHLTWDDFQRKEPEIANEIQDEIESNSSYLWEREAGYVL